MAEVIKCYDCYIWIIPEFNMMGSGYVVSMPHLPGTCSQGDTVEEAIANIKEAFQGIAASYLETDGKIPWLSGEEIGKPPNGTKEKWIPVEVFIDE